MRESTCKMVEFLTENMDNTTAQSLLIHTSKYLSICDVIYNTNEEHALPFRVTTVNQRLSIVALIPDF